MDGTFKIVQSENIDITAIILTYNEEIHIERCILSLKKFIKEIVVIDSYSNDRTLEICKNHDIRVFKNKFRYQAHQTNWALKNIDIKTEWIIRVDADEYLLNDFNIMLNDKLKGLDKDISGIVINRKIKFLGKIINYGSTSPHKTLRIWRRGMGFYEDSVMDEQLIVNGKTTYLNTNLIDENLKSLKWFIKKHSNYAAREAISYLNYKEQTNSKYSNSDYSKINKKKKYKIYYRLPIFIRPFIFFFYSYFIKLGFLSGWQGLIFNVIQVLWYRIIVDFEILKLRNRNKFS